MAKEYRAHRRKFLRTSAVVAGTALAAGISAPIAEAVNANSNIPKGDKDILRLLAALEILETDLWVQYNELGGIKDREEPSGSGNKQYELEARLIGHLRTEVNDVLERRIKLRKLRK